MKATTTTQRRAAIADVHRMKAIAAMSDEDYRAMLASYGVEHSTELSDAQLSDLRGRMHQLTDAENAVRLHAWSDDTLRKANVWRKRVYAVIGSWLTASGYQNTAQAIRTVACRAAHRKRFANITPSELKQIYHSWKKKEATIKGVMAEKQALEICLN